MIGTKARHIHMRIDIRGAIMNWSDSEWRNCIKDNDGKMLSPDEVKRGFLEELSKGNDYLPLGDCDNFDPKKGCLGHPVSEVE
jgi:hypothetical protein